jgi:cobalt-zinc-cadmium efflux system outer membrane protein
LEHNKAQVAYSQVRIQHRQAQNLLEDARRQLAAQWNQRALGFEQARGSLEDIGDMPSFDALARQLYQNPDVARWETEVERSRAQEELQKAGGKQDFTLSAGMQRFNETDDNAVVFGISIPLPIFDRNQGNIAAARYQTRRIQEQQKDAEAQVHAALSTAYEMLSSTYVEASETKEHILENARQAFENAQEAWRQGKIDYLNVLDAQRTYFEAQTQYIASVAAFQAVQADVRRLTGAPVLQEQMNTDTKEEQTHE